MESDECEKLVHWLHGCRRAGQAWEDHYSNVLMNMGFESAASCPVAFYRVAWAVVHGDDFVFTGTDVDLDFILVELSSHYESEH